MSVALKKPIFDGISNAELAQQLEGKKKSRGKLPTWFETPQIYFPKKVNIEQTSSEQTAKYKSNLVEGKTLMDITGGLGIDSFFFSKQMEEVVHCEIDTELCEIAQHNFKILGANNIEVHNLDGLKYLDRNEAKVDWVYADPSRRDDSGGRVFKLKDTLPSIPAHLESIFEKTENVLLKTAPLLDINLGLAELSQVKQIHVVAVKNEVKELLWILKQGFTGEPKIVSVNLQNGSQERFEFFLSEEKNTSPSFSLPKKYLYEPNPSLLKAGAFKLVGRAFDLEKLHQHSHLYTSDKKIEFLGRMFEIESVHPYNKMEIKKLGIKKANITTRNFPETVANIRKKFNIADGGKDYLFFTTDMNEKLISIKCHKILP